MVAGEFVVSGGDAAPVLETTPHALDALARFVGLFVIGNGYGAGCGRGDYRFGALRGEATAQVVGVIGAVGDEPPDQSSPVEKAGRDGGVIDVAGG